MRNILSIGVGLVVLLGFVLITIGHKPIVSPKGVVLPLVVPEHSSNPNKIMVYNSKPTGFSEIAVVRVELHDDQSVANPRIEMINYAKQLASRVGAHQLLIDGIYHTNKRSLSDKLAAYQLYAEAGITR